MQQTSVDSIAPAGTGPAGALVVVTEGETSIRDARYTGDAMRALAGESVGAVLVQR